MSRSCPVAGNPAGNFGLFSFMRAPLASSLHMYVLKQQAKSLQRNGREKGHKNVNYHLKDLIVDNKKEIT